MSPQLFISSAAAPLEGPKPVLTMGNYDGVHLGHQALISETVTRARAAGLPAMVYTFEPPPREVLGAGRAHTRILGLADKLDLLERLGVDQVCIEPFSMAFAAHPAAWFAQEVLQRRLRAASLVVGHDFRFGRGREGDADSLVRWTGLEVANIDACLWNEAPVSSSRIRECLARGQVEAAAAMLSRAHHLRGVVVSGERRGRALGFPTANVLPASGSLPGVGVYAVLASVDGGAFLPGVANIGHKPTFRDPDAVDPLLEVHLFPVGVSIGADDLYGRELVVAFPARVRDEQRFAGAAELQAQIRADIQAAAALLGV